MSIIQVGSKLVRTFGSGSNLRHAITETVGNKTFTEVLDSEGKLLANRVKEITRQNIGDKLVITRKEISPCTKEIDNQRDLIYDKDGKFLGMRVLDWFFGGFKGKPAIVLKVNADGIGRWKYCNVNRADVDGIRATTYSLYGKLRNCRGTNGIPHSRSDAKKMFKSEPILTCHNKHGIPIPHSVLDIGYDKEIMHGDWPLRKMISAGAFAKGSGYEFLNYVKPKFDILKYANDMKW